TLAATWDGVVLYDVATRRVVRTLATPRDTDLTVKFSPDGKLLAAGGIGGTIYRWDAATGAARPPIHAHPIKVWDLAFSPDGRTLATAAGSGQGPGEVKLWDPATGKLLTAHDPKSRSA